jgi:hypothetical protein
MARWTLRLALLTLLPWLMVEPAWAQQEAAAQPSQEQQTQSEVDANKLPVNLGRLQRRLNESVEREQGNGPMFRYTVDVFARAPRIELFTPDDNLLYGPTRFTAPTHQEMMNLVTPQEFRSPIMDFSNLMRWLQDRSKSDKK